MRFSAFIACEIVALQAAQGAVGAKEQVLFSQDYAAVWWIFAAYWAIAGFMQFTRP